jgi:ABC-2 type transport system permease protein
MDLALPRKLYKTAAMAAASFVGDSPLFVLDYLLRFLRVAVLLAIWRSILEGRGPVSGMTLGAVLTYTLVSEVFAELLACRTDLPESLWDGSIAVRYLEPLGMVEQFAARAMGKVAFGLACFSLPLFLAAPLLGVNPLPHGPVAGLAFLVSLPLAVAVALALDFLFGIVLVLVEHNVWVFSNVRRALETLLSGALIPLALLPWGIGEAFQWLPFAATASTPLRIYTGTGDPLALLASQAAWCLILWPATLGLWSRFRERLVSYGG